MIHFTKIIRERFPVGAQLIAPPVVVGKAERNQLRPYRGKFQIDIDILHEVWDVSEHISA